MKVGYARTSTADQVAGFEAQDRDLKTAGCDKTFREQVSSVSQRPQLEAALDFLRDGDTLVVTKLDRLARSVPDLVRITEAVRQTGAHLQVLAMALNTADATGRMMLNVLGSIAQFEREMMLERQREGIQKAKAEGKYRGRKATARAKAPEIATLKAQGVRPVDIARRLGIGRASVYRALSGAA
jgi:DNA invertase Pin-like site-specific DNA recombinase